MLIFRGAFCAFLRVQKIVVVFKDKIKVFWPLGTSRKLLTTVYHVLSHIPSVFEVAKDSFDILTKQER